MAGHANDRIALVTGAGRGIGRALAMGFAAEGAKVICCARSVQQIEDTAAAIERQGGQAIALPCDVGDAAQVDRMFAMAEQAWGRIDIVIANAGTQGPLVPVADSDPADWEAVIRTNLLGSYHILRAAVPALRRAGGGHIIGMGSGAALYAIPGRSPYVAAKAALHMLLRVVAQEVIEDRISVNELVPGPVDTAMLRTSKSAGNIVRTEWFKQPEDVVPMALFIASLPPDGPTGQLFSLRRRP